MQSVGLNARGAIFTKSEPRERATAREGQVQTVQVEQEVQ